MIDRPVTERDLRAPEFRNGDPDDYEFRDDGKIVRKDRWEVSLRNIASILGWARRDWEVVEVVEEVRCRLEPDWEPIDPEELPSPGEWLVSVATDNGPQVHVLELNGQGEWIHEGEPTFSHSYFFQPTHYKSVPAPFPTEDA